MFLFPAEVEMGMPARKAATVAALSMGVSRVLSDMFITEPRHPEGFLEQVSVSPLPRYCDASLGTHLATTLRHVLHGNITQGYHGLSMNGSRLEACSQTHLVLYRHS